MAWLAVKRGRRCHHDDNSMLSIVSDRCSLSHVREALTNEVDGASYVDIHDKVEVVEVKGVSVAVENLQSRVRLVVKA